LLDNDIVLLTSLSTLPSTSQLELTSVEEQAQIGSTEEACVPSSLTYDQQMPSIMEETVAQQQSPPVDNSEEEMLVIITSTTETVELPSA